MTHEYTIKFESRINRDIDDEEPLQGSYSRFQDRVLIEIKHETLNLREIFKGPIVRISDDGSIVNWNLGISV